MSPTSHALRRTSSGQVPSRSYSQATGRISFSAKSCAISRSAFCSSVSVKSTTVSLHSRLTGQSTSSLDRVPHTRDWSRAPDSPHGIEIAAALWHGRASPRRDRLVVRRGAPCVGVVGSSSLVVSRSRSYWRSSRAGGHRQIGRGGIGETRAPPAPAGAGRHRRARRRDPPDARRAQRPPPRPRRGRSRRRGRARSALTAPAPTPPCARRSASWSWRATSPRGAAARSRWTSRPRSSAGCASSAPPRWRPSRSRPDAARAALDVRIAPVGDQRGDDPDRERRDTTTSVSTGPTL